ncbi:hypothetical protein GOP47_0021618 [Adiantum capillus-veneris]|uniref:Uncharacterized protein n=1 Tax=Adiantum capillus-veneris TaxID=13818 RepID=A0A9D4Z815_ADICA|nr:hypothetical protein GOP47_0021618 [Adiantum capillus-veneris]
MRKPNNRVWAELKKELVRSSNLVWVAALLIWLVLSTSRYSHWHSLSHHLLHSTWLSGTHNTQLTHRHHSQNSASLSSSNASASWVPELKGTFTDANQRTQFKGLQDGINVHREYDYDDDDMEVNSTRSSHQDNELALVAPDLHQAPHQHSAGTTLENVVYLHNSDSEERANVMHIHNLSQVVETVKEQSTFETTSSQYLYKFQNAEARGSPSKSCATVEEMGRVAVSSYADSTLRVRKRIKAYFRQNGASHVRELPAKEFCQRGFVFGRAAEDGLGNDIYKILTAAGLSIMLNRSLIVAEHGSANPAYFGLAGHVRLPFGDYLRYSNETFSLSEVKRLWVKHDCAGEYQRPLTMIVDDFQRPTRTKVFCEDWAKWRHPIIWFKGTTDSNGLQFFLKNQHRIMRELALVLFGDPSKPSSRPNVFGELFKAFISPMPVIEEAVNWALQGRPDPDVAVHMRMLNSRSRAALYAVCSCIRTVLKDLSQSNLFPQVVIVSDTPLVIKHIKGQLEGFAQVSHFDYKFFMDSHHNLSKVMTGNYFQPPEKRVKDWGAMPRWVAIVDMFLAARAKVAVISGANRRVGTTYAQLLASLAAATRTVDKTQGAIPFKFYSSFQTSLLAEGLAGQRGWGHVWRRFAGHLSCKNQSGQCAETPLLPYAWWDGPWQSPAPRDVQRMLAYGIRLSEAGHVEEASLPKTCMSRKAPLEIVQLMLPSCKRLKLCRQ